MPSIKSTVGDPLGVLASITKQGARRHCHPVKVKGRFARIRPFIYWGFFAAWALAPWIQMNGNPLIQFDIAARRFHLFGESFNAQDAWLAFFFITGLAFLLFVLSALWGRIWCGFACPHTVILETVYRPIETLWEGKPGARKKRNKKGPAGWSKGDWGRKIGKWGTYVVLSITIAHIFVAYFVSVPRLFEMVRHNPTENWVPFLWVATMSAAIFFNFAWFREQLCFAICPYGRLQSVLADVDTVVIGYDKKRGEPRGRGDGKGDCIDCNKCVAVCPTGIDIRNGLQMECVGCAACIDACEGIMTKQGKPLGLIRFDSVAGFEGARKRFWRPRVFIYLVAGIAGIIAFTTAWSVSDPFQANILRLGGAPYTVTDGVVRNSFELHVENKRASELQLTVGNDLPSGFELVTPLPQVTLEGQSGQHLPIFISIPVEEFTGDISFDLVLFDGETAHRVTGRFIGPNL